ncbi:MAG: TetM/TetW/TetO/TetS family tetracycline resistance ribosomal protection protein [Clostridiales bacterium]|nr:TetM/TetW/TetO/TetS family tetracycline resistance ribosomal protection protein [Clostridiales bacterium]
MKLVIGILAHVDAGKTTLSEAMLYLTGSIRRLGRVDNRDAFLDTDEIERERGITIFSSQAVFPLGDRSVTLLDTPGHVDFSPEMERTLQVLDYAVLVVSGADGVQGHTETLWRLLRRYRIPTVLFVNKMDQAGTDRERLMEELRQRLDDGCVDFGGWDSRDGEADVRDALSERAVRGDEWLKGRPEAWLENLAVCDEAVLESYLESGKVKAADVRRMIAERKLFPCFFGSALKVKGISELLSGIRMWSRSSGKKNADFGAKVFKITRDGQGSRLTHLKVTGGTLKVKECLPGTQEKVNQIRIYSGTKYESVTEADAGTVCAVTGPSETRPGQGLGAERESELPVLEPVLTCRLELPEGCDAAQMLRNIRQLEDEEPELHVVWDEEHGDIQVQIMGDVQTEILRARILERYGVDVRFGTGNIVYKETIVNPVEGVGHFEPLRHYAEVHLLMEPGEPGSGLQFEAAVSEDVLDRNWQRLILTHLEEKSHRGVLTGSEITDMKITLVAGRAHLKHTEGGDFRQATYRAVRQGLCEAQCRLLEPFYQFRLEIPAENVGRAMTDLEQMNGTFFGPEPDGTQMVMTGTAPVRAMRDYQRELVSYTKGRGRLACDLAGYFPCQNEDEVIAAIHYEADADMENPTGSVFCAHGAGFVVPWDEVKQYMHLQTPPAVAAVIRRWSGEQEADRETAAGQEEALPATRRLVGRGGASAVPEQTGSRAFGADEKELEAIFTRTYGESRRRMTAENSPRRVTYRGGESAAAFGEEPDRGGSRSDALPTMGRPGYDRKSAAKLPEYLLVDGYNIIYAWEELRELAETTIDGARRRLMDILCNYQPYRGCTLIVVFDAYKVTGGLGSAQDYHNIHVVYTKEAETADQYIEKLAHRIGRKYRVTVATSDGLEQLIIHGQGCILMSAKELREDIARADGWIAENLERLERPQKAGLFAGVDEETRAGLKKLRGTEE